MSRRSSKFRVVCLGASAGGLEAYLTILRALPANTGMAYVLIPHRSPDNPELLPSIVAGATAMPVRHAEDGMRLAADSVYIAQPRVNLTMRDGTFRVKSEPPPRGWPKTITQYLLSLAKSMGERSVAIILSGLDADGSEALTAVKQAGGITIAQADPRHESMPEAAVETGAVDYFLDADRIAPLLVSLSQKPLP